MKLLSSVSTICSVVSMLSALRASVDRFPNPFPSNKDLWEFCEYNELPEESRRESLSCAICLEPLETPGIYGYTNIAICHESAKHMFHASCLFRNTFKTGNAPRCPTCRCPFVPTKFHESFLEVIRKATTGNKAASDRDSDIYKYVSEHGILLHISSFDYSRLFIPERALLLAILTHIKCNRKKDEDQEHANIMTQEFAGDMITDIMAYESGGEKVLGSAREISDNILSQLCTSPSQVCWDTIKKDMLDVVSKKNGVLSNFSFLLFSNLVYLVIESKLSCKEKVQRLTELIPAYCQRRKLKLNQLYALLHLLITEFPDHHESLMNELEKKDVVAYFLGIDPVPHRISTILPMLKLCLLSASDERMRDMIQDINLTV